VTSIDGGVTLRLDAEDFASGSDKIGFTVLSSKTSDLYYSNNWILDATNAWKTVVQALGTGILQIK